MKRLAAEANNAKAAFTECLEHYGEDAKSLDTNAFFAVLVRFVAGWKAAEAENEKRKKLEKARLLAKENNNSGGMEARNNFHNQGQE